MGSTGMSNLLRGILAGAVMCAAAHVITAAARAEGAIAIGASGNFSKDGFAFGGAINKSSTEAAICRVVMTFSRECYALSFDPKPGTPGVGWAISDDKVKAEERAQKNCEVTAGAGRRDFCKVNQSYCDTHD